MMKAVVDAALKTYANMGYTGGEDRLEFGIKSLLRDYFVNVAAKIPSLIEKGKRVFFFPQLTEIKGYNLKLVENTANKQKDT